MTEVIVEDIFKRGNVDFIILMMFKLCLTNKIENVLVGLQLQSSIFIAAWLLSLMCIYPCLLQSDAKPIRLGIGEYACPFCQFVSKTAANCEMHIRVHTGIKPYTCPYCNAAFTQKGNCKKHINTKCPKNPNNQWIKAVFLKSNTRKWRSFLCLLQTFQSTKPIRLGIGQFSCPFCGMVKKSAANCEMHIRVHTGEKPYNCPYCNDSFTQVGNRNKHVKTKCLQNPNRIQW